MGSHRTLRCFRLAHQTSVARRSKSPELAKASSYSPRRRCKCTRRCHPTRAQSLTSVRGVLCHRVHCLKHCLKHSSVRGVFQTVFGTASLVVRHSGVMNAVRGVFQQCLLAERCAPHRTLQTASGWLVTLHGVADCGPLAALPAIRRCFAVLHDAYRHFLQLSGTVVALPPCWPPM